MDRIELRERLRRVGLTCDEFAALTGASVRTVYEWGGPRSSVPYSARVVLLLIEERGGAHGLLGRVPQSHGWRMSPQDGCVAQRSRGRQGSSPSVRPVHPSSEASL